MQRQVSFDVDYYNSEHRDILMKHKHFLRIQHLVESGLIENEGGYDDENSIYFFNI